MTVNMKSKFVRIAFSAVALAALATLSACSPEVGSKEWCQQMKEKPKGDWSANEATDFAKHCVL